MKKKKIRKQLLILIMLAGAIIIFPKDAKAAECSGSTVCGSTCTQGSLTYGTVLGEDGKCWLDRNLGATQVATSSNDSASYGWLFQWGRGADGHQIRTSQVTSTPSSTDVPGHDLFIHGIGYDADWRDPRNDNLWQGVNGINNPCPAGFRLPTQQEWITLLISADITNSVTAFDSVLKLPLGGYRGHVGSYEDEYRFKYYWSSTVDDGRALSLLIGLPEDRGFYNDTVSAPRAAGFSVRCLADTTNIEEDEDGDGVNDDVDNCPSNANPEQADLDNDGLGDICDPEPGCTFGQIRQCWNTGLPGVCSLGIQGCQTNHTWENCRWAPVYYPDTAQVPEICDGLDNDCDGTVDDDCATCGNGQVNTGEQCDDGNTTTGDGCNATCQLDNDNDGVINFDDCAPNDVTILIKVSTKACELWTKGVPGKGILTAPGLQKPLN